MTPKQIIEEFRNAVGGWKIAEPCALQDVPFFRDIQDWLINHHIQRLEEEIEWLEEEKKEKPKKPMRRHVSKGVVAIIYNEALDHIIDVKQKELEEWKALLDN